MATKDLHNSINVVEGLYPASITTTKAADNAADMQGYESAEFVFTIGAVTGSATPTASPVLEESSDNSTFTAIAAADLIGGALPATFGTTDANTVYKRGYRGTLRYIRARISATAGTSPNFTLGCAIVQSHPRHLPTPSTL